jgi:RimJ/RimL family protein N-acetyltransferase
MVNRHWIVICPERYARRGIWHVWYRENCVAIGWPPSKYHPEGETDSAGWRWARDCMRKMQPGELVIPYLQQWRVGPVGVIKRVHLADEDWSPTVAKGDYTQNPSEAELGRRIDVEWRSEGMPPDAMAALIPSEKRLQALLQLGAGSVSVSPIRLSSVCVERARMLIVCIWVTQECQ